MQHDQAGANTPQLDLPPPEGTGAPDYDAFVDHIFHELSQPVSALWCALEVAALRAPDAEEDRQDLLAAFAVVEELGKKVRSLRDAAEARSRRPAVENLRQL